MLITESIVWLADEECVGMREGDLCGKLYERYVDVVFSERDGAWVVYYDNKRYFTRVYDRDFAIELAESLPEKLSLTVGNHRV